MRIEARRGHRLRVLHGFITNDPEQIRGMPLFAPAIKFFLDLNDYLDAELVSNIVTAAFALFVETGGGVDPYYPALRAATLTENALKGDGTTYQSSRTPNLNRDRVVKDACSRMCAMNMQSRKCCETLNTCSIWWGKWATLTRCVTR